MAELPKMLAFWVKYDIIYLDFNCSFCESIRANQETKVKKFLQAIGPFHATAMIVVAALIGMLLIATPVKSQTILDCVAEERAQWSVIGTAQYEGEPWQHTWYTTQQWDNDAGTWVDIQPIARPITVPGERLVVTLEDGTGFTYGEPLTDANRGIWADNLYSIATYSMVNVTPPYYAAKRSDGAVYLINVNEDGTCKVGWNLGHVE